MIHESEAARKKQIIYKIVQLQNYAQEALGCHPALSSLQYICLFFSTQKMSTYSQNYGVYRAATSRTYYEKKYSLFFQ